jgi:hypothetical protein
MKRKSKSTPPLRGQSACVSVVFSGVEAAALDTLAKHFLNPVAQRRTLAAKKFTVKRLVCFALRDIDHTLARWETFRRYAGAEGFDGPAEKWELLNRQIEQAWATSPKAKALRGAR